MIPKIPSTSATMMRQTRSPGKAKAEISRTTPAAINQIPSNSATARTPPSGWRMSSTPAITLNVPITASNPRFSVSPRMAPTISKMPSIRMKIPRITASVDRLLLGFRITMIPATMLSAPISSASHQPHVRARISREPKDVPDKSTSSVTHGRYVTQTLPPGVDGDQAGSVQTS